MSHYVDMMKKAQVIILAFLLAFMPIGSNVMAVEQAVIAGMGAIPVEINKGKLIKLEHPVSAVVIADPVIADVQVVSQRLLFVRGKKVGETSIYAMDNKDNPMFSAVLQITHNLSKLEETVKSVSPDADITFRSVDGGLVLEGYSPSAGDTENINNIATGFLGEGEKVMNNIRTSGSDQVTLQVKIVEMKRENAKRFGINMQNMFGRSSGMSLQVLQGRDIEIDSDRVLNDRLREVGRTGILDRDGATTTQILASARGGRISNLIDALETQGLLSVLAEPTLTTTSGKTANFLAGGEFPIAVNGGNNTVTVEYKPFGVSLNFTPVVMSKDLISVTVAPEVSTISANTIVTTNQINNPIILTRKAQSTVEMASGQTFALAGLLKHDMANNIAKFPGLGDLPILGTLFRSTDFQNDQTELVILVTPYIVHPIKDKKMKTPLDGYVPPTETQRLFKGQLYQQEPMEEEAPKPAETKPESLLQGLGGFLTE